MAFWDLVNFITAFISSSNCAALSASCFASNVLEMGIKLLFIWQIFILLLIFYENLYFPKYISVDSTYSILPPNVLYDLKKVYEILFSLWVFSLSTKVNPQTLRKMELT